MASREMCVMSAPSDPELSRTSESGSSKQRRVSWGNVDVAILDETDFTAERESVLDGFESSGVRVARLKAAHRARVAARRRKEENHALVWFDIYAALHCCSCNISSHFYCSSVIVIEWLTLRRIARHLSAQEGLKDIVSTYHNRTILYYYLYLATIFSIQPRIT